MASVKLTTFALYRVDGSDPDAKIKVLDGATDARFADDGRIELLAGSVPFHSSKLKAPKPGEGLLMLYGTRDVLEEMQHWRAVARKLECEFASAEIEFSVGHIESGLTDRDTLKNNVSQRFLNVRRMKVSLQSNVLFQFDNYAKQEGGPLNEDMKRVHQIATRPDFFGRLLDEDSELAQLDILVIPVVDHPDASDRMRQMAYVRPGGQIVSAVQSNDRASIVLPHWMTDKAEAADLRNRDKT